MRVREPGRRRRAARALRASRVALTCLLSSLGLSRMAAAEPRAPGVAVSEPPAPGAPRSSLLEHLAAGRDLLRTAPAIASFEGGWSIVMQWSTLLTSRRWDAPYPHGLVAQQAVRVLYGSSWTAMIALETLAASVASGGRFDWLAEAHYRTDWLFGVTAPSCPSPGAGAGCGLGIGGFGGFHVRPVGSPFWYEVTGGWIEQRVASDSQRTLEDSAWVLTPLSVTYALNGSAGPVRLDARVGPGAYFGMRAAHLHPTPEGARVLDVPWHELYPRHVGVGPGMRAGLGVTFARTLRVEGGLVLAPLVLGSRHSRALPELAPLPRESPGIPWWRAATLGLGMAPTASRFGLGVSLFAAELSTRPLEKLGHRGVMLRFDFPLRASSPPAE